MPKREFLMLAHNFDSKKHSPCGMYASEKLDGVRCFWDGGISRGLPCTDVPWANVEKHDRFLISKTATGLWTRYGQPIAAAEFWINLLPKFALDGELTLGRGQFQDTISCVRSHSPTAAWARMQYRVFDAPSLFTVMADGEIKNTNFKKQLSGIAAWLSSRGTICHISRPFYQTLTHLKQYLSLDSLVTLHDQYLLPASKLGADMELDTRLAAVLEAGGEGIMLRNPVSFWAPERSYKLLKVKGSHDMEGTVIGYTWGEKTDKGSKLLGLMGSLRLKLESGKEFDLSGFTDAERVMKACYDCEDPFGIARIAGEYGHGLRVNDAMYVNPAFPIGAVVTFQYRELTKDGLPKEARYWRKD